MLSFKIHTILESSKASNGLLTCLTGEGMIRLGLKEVVPVWDVLPGHLALRPSPYNVPSPAAVDIRILYIWSNSSEDPQ